MYSERMTRDYPHRYEGRESNKRHSSEKYNKYEKLSPEYSRKRRRSPETKNNHYKPTKTDFFNRIDSIPNVNDYDRNNIKNLDDGVLSTSCDTYIINLMENINNSIRVMLKRNQKEITITKDYGLLCDTGSNIKAKTLLLGGFWDPETKTHSSKRFRDVGIDDMPLEKIKKTYEEKGYLIISNFEDTFNPKLIIRLLNNNSPNRSK